MMRRAAYPAFALRLGVWLAHVLMVGWVVVVTMPPARSETLSPGEFSKKLVWLHPDSGGKPSDSRNRKAVGDLKAAEITVLGWDDDSQMLLLAFKDGDKGWVRNTDIVLPSSICDTPQKPAYESTVAPRGQSIASNTATSRGLVEKACRK